MRYLKVLLTVLVVIGLSGCVKDKNIIPHRIDYPSLWMFHPLLIFLKLVGIKPLCFLHLLQQISRNF